MSKSCSETDYESGYESGYESCFEKEQKYNCSCCNIFGYYHSLQEAYDDGWFEFDDAYYCSDHASEAIDMCDNSHRCNKRCE